MNRSRRACLALAGLAAVAASGAAGQVLDRSSFDACFRALGPEASGAPCIVPLREFCARNDGGLGLQGETNCLDRVILAFESWSDQTLAETPQFAALRPQLLELRSRLDAHCAAEVSDNGIGMERDFRLCQLAGVGAIHRNILRLGADQDGAADGVGRP